jgi:hypothetical protein
MNAYLSQIEYHHRIILSDIIMRQRIRFFSFEKHSANRVEEHTFFSFLMLKPMERNEKINSSSLSLILQIIKNILM